jgi:hypothetical protein
MSRRSTLALSLLLTTLALPLAPLSAQIGGLVRRAARTAITDPKANTEAAVPNIKAEDQLTAEHLVAFEKGLNAEDAFRKNALRQAANVKTPAAYQACMMTAMQSDDYQKLMQGYTDEIQKANGKVEESTAAMNRFTENLKKLVELKCGANPDEVGPNNAWKVEQGATEAGVSASGVPSTRYAQWKERVVPFCNLPASKRSGGGVVRAESYAYLANEVEALTPRCASLMPKIKLGS